MEEQERQPPEAERIKDLEVSDDEARDIAGGESSSGDLPTESISLNRK